MHRYLISNRRALLQLSIFSILLSITLYTYTNIENLQESIINIARYSTIAFTALSLISILHRIGFIQLLALFGFLIVIGSIIMPIKDYIPSVYNDLDTFTREEGKVKHLVWKYTPAKALTPSASMVMFYLGVSIIALCNMILYKPSMLYARNRPQDPQYPIWDSSKGYTTYKYRGLVPLYKLLNEEERHMVVRYRYILARIGDRLYLVTIDSLVPIDTQIVRRGKIFYGIQ